MPHVSVVIPAYNAAPFITKAISSVLNQTFTDLELLVVDDGSTDSTAAVVKSLQDFRLRLYSTPNQGVERSRNLGIEKARGEWVAFLDADDWWEPNKLQRQLEFLQTQPEVVITSTHGKYVGSKGKVLGKLQYGPLSSEQLDRRRDRLKPIWLLTSSVLCKREALLDVGGFNPEFRGAAEDLDLWTRISYSYPAITLPEQLVNFRISGQSASMSKYRLIQEHTLWVYQNLIHQQDRHVAMSHQQFRHWLTTVDEKQRRKWEREWQSGFFYRNAGHDFIEGRLISGATNLAKSFWARPDVPVDKLKRQFLPAKK